MVTKADPKNRGWGIEDRVVALSEFGLDRSHSLVKRSEWIVGTGPECTLKVDDPRVSGRHVRLVDDDGVWSGVDLSSTNGTELDGHRRTEFSLAPGAELRIGGVTLVAYSARLEDLRAYVERILGWNRRNDVDVAIRGLRDAAMRRINLVLCGEGDLVPIAQRLHDHAIGEVAPFVVAPQASAIGAFEAATNGTLCMRAKPPPRDLELVIAASKRDASHVRLVLHAASANDATQAMIKLGRTTLIELPSIASRRVELDKLIAGYTHDAIVALGVVKSCFQEHELDRLRRIDYTSHEDLAFSMMRVVAIRNFTLRGAAKRLRIHHTSLGRWARRRGIPT